MGNLDSVIELKAKIKAIKPKNPCGCSGDMSGGGYDDTEIKNRVEALENKPDNDTIYDDAALTQRVETLENKPDNDTIYDDRALVARVKVLEDKKSASLSVASLSNTGGTEIQSSISQEANSILFNYQKNTKNELPNYINAQINGDSFSLATTAYVDNAVSSVQGGNTTTGRRTVVGEERLIGEFVWDGVSYDHYEKIIDFGELPNNDQKAVAHGIPNPKTIIKVYGEARNASNNLTIPFISDDGSLFIYLGVGNNKNITIKTNSDRSSYNALIYIEYLVPRA